MSMPVRREMAADARRSLFIYNLLFPVVFLAMLPGFFVRMLRRGQYREKFGQRLGLFCHADRQRLAQHRWLWIHSISVGETLMALKLARHFHALDPAQPILLSTTTTTGFALANESQSDWLEVIYNPIDFLPIVRRVLRLLRPTALLLIEGEVWPNLVAQCHLADIPTALINARLSPRSEARFHRFRAWTGPIFRLLKLICLAEREDHERWLRLNLPAEKLAWTGSIKFDNTTPVPSRAEEFRQLVAPFGFTPETPILVAGSTHDGEEEILARAVVELRRAIPDLRLILVPRHIERADAILRDLAPLGLRIVRRTGLANRPQPSTLNPQLLLVDTTGELRHWYELATVVFVGKTLTATGGQNPAEPAILGQPTIVGPHMENFAALTAHLLARGALVQVPEAATLPAELRDLLTNPARRAELGARAREALAEHQGATSRTAELLRAIFLQSA